MRRHLGFDFGVIIQPLGLTLHEFSGLGLHGVGVAQADYECLSCRVCHMLVSIGNRSRIAGKSFKQAIVPSFDRASSSPLEFLASGYSCAPRAFGCFARLERRSLRVIGASPNNSRSNECARRF
jgi:hypothetical protein